MKISKCLLLLFACAPLLALVIQAEATTDLVNSNIQDLSCSNIEDVVFGSAVRTPWVVSAYYGPCYNCVYDSLTLIFLALNLRGKAHNSMG